MHPDQATLQEIKLEQVHRQLNVMYLKNIKSLQEQKVQVALIIIELVLHQRRKTPRCIPDRNLILIKVIQRLQSILQREVNQTQIATLKSHILSQRAQIQKVIPHLLARGIAGHTQHQVGPLEVGLIPLPHDQVAEVQDHLLQEVVAAHLQVAQVEEDKKWLD